MTQTTLSPILRHLRTLAEAQGMRDLTDGELLERFRDGGEEAAFTLLVQRHGPMVLSVSRRVLHDWHAAEDVFQATFLVLAKKAGSVRKTASVASWLHGVAHRIATKALRRSTRIRRQERRPFDMAPAEPLDELTLQELRLALDEAIAGLPEKYKVPLILHYLEGKSHEQAARELGWPKTSFSSRLARARELLREQLGRRGLALSAGLVSTALTELAAPAAVSALLVLSTVRGSSLSLVGKVAATGAVSAQAAGFAEEAVKAMNLSQLKVILALVLSAGLAATGAGVAALQLSAARQPQVGLEGGAKGARTDVHPLDADGRPLPAGAVHRLGSRRFRIEGRTDFALPAPDGKHILVHPQPAMSSCAAQGLMLLDADTGLRLRAFEDSRRVPKSGEYAAIRPAAFSPDGAKLYALGWHKSEKDGDGFAQWAYFDNPSKRVLLVWDVATGKLTAEWDLPSGGWVGASLLGVNVSPDGKRVYVYGAVRIGSLFNRNVRGVPGVHVLDAATGKRLQTWDSAGHPVGFTAGGKELITFRKDAPITAHDAETGKPGRTFPLAGYVPSVALSADGRSVAAVGITGYPSKPACEIKLWEAATGREIRRLTADGKTVGYWARLVFAADGKILYLSTESGRILRWDLSDGRALPDWHAHSGMVADLFLRPGRNELVSVGTRDGAIRRWDATAGKALSTTDAYVGEVAVARTPEGKGIVAVDSVGRLEVWDVTTGRVTKTLQTPGRKRHELLFTPDGKHLLVAAETGLNTVWDLSAGKQVDAFAPPPKLDPKADEYWWGVLGFSPDGRRLVASKFGRGTWMWAWPERRILWHEAKEQECCFFPDGEVVVCADWNKAIELRDSQTGAVKRTLPGSGMAHVAFSHDRLRMVTAHLDGAWRVRDGITGAVLKEVKGFQHVWCVAFSSSGWLLAVAGDKSVRVYDTASWQEVARLDGHDGTVGTVFFGPDEASLVSASAEDGTALVWSLKSPAGRALPDPAQLWADLAGDGPAVRRAVWAAAQHPDAAVQLFREKWPVPKHPIDPKRVGELIVDLDSPVFAKREAATAELKKLGRRAEAELRKESLATASAEVKRRAERILARWEPPGAAEYSAEDARELRAVWALELAGTPEARKLLAEWAAAKVGNRLCAEAAAAVKRLQRKYDREGKG